MNTRKPGSWAGSLRRRLPLRQSKIAAGTSGFGTDFARSVCAIVAIVIVVSFFTLLALEAPGTAALIAAFALFLAAAIKFGRIAFLAVYLFLLMFGGRTFSAFTVFGVPAAVLAMVALLIVYHREVVRFLKSSRLAAGITFLLLLWTAWTMVRLTVDFPIYGNLALRDAIITFCFISVLLGGGAGLAHATAQSRSRFGYLMAAGMSSLVLLYIGRAALPASVSGFVEFGNISIASFALLVLGLWGSGRSVRILWLVFGGLGLVTSQSRAIYLVVAITLVFYLLSSRSQTEHPFRIERFVLGRFFVLLVLLASGLVMLFLIEQSQLAVGRIGGVSLSDLLLQFSSVFQDDTMLAGSVNDRERWWTDLLRELGNFTTVSQGLGLGPDLLNGFTASDGSLVRKPHNDYLETAVRFGVLSGLILVFIAVVGIIRSVRALGSSDLATISAAWVVAAAASSFTQPYFAYPHGAVTTAMAIGLLLALQSEASLPNKSSRGLGR